LSGRLQERPHSPLTQVWTQVSVISTRAARDIEKVTAVISRRKVISEDCGLISGWDGSSRVTEGIFCDLVIFIIGI
jgi:hypothetical protein